MRVAPFVAPRGIIVRVDKERRERRRGQGSGGGDNLRLVVLGDASGFDRTISSESDMSETSRRESLALKKAEAEDLREARDVASGRGLVESWITEGGGTALTRVRVC